MEMVYAVRKTSKGLAMESNGVLMTGKIANKNQMAIALEQQVSIQQAVKIDREMKQYKELLDNTPTIKDTVVEDRVDTSMFAIVNANAKRAKEEQAYLAWETEQAIKRDLARTKKTTLKSIIRDLLK